MYSIRILIDINWFEMHNSR